MAAGRIIIEAAQPSLDANANLINGATLTFLNADTLAPAPVYSDSTLATSLGNVVTASGGFFPDMWAADGAAFRVEWRNAAGSLLRTFPRIEASASSVPISAWAATLLNDTSAAEGRATLGAASAVDVANVPPDNNAPQQVLIGDSVAAILPVSALAPALVVDQLINSATATILALKFPSDGAYGAGDEGFYKITAPGGVNDFVIPDGYNVTDSRAWLPTGASWSGVSLTFPTSPSRVSFNPAPSAGDVIWLQRRAGAFFRTTRARSLRITVSLSGGLPPGNGTIKVRALVNGTATGNTLEGQLLTTVQVGVYGTIELLNVPSGAYIQLEVTQSNLAGGAILIAKESTFLVQPIHQTGTRSDGMGVFGLQQGASLLSTDEPQMAAMDAMFISNTFSGMVAQSGAVARGQEFFDGYVSSFNTALPGLLRSSRVSRPLTGNPGGRKDYAYVAASVAAPDGTFAGQAVIDRFPTPAGQTVFTLTRDVFFVPTGGGFGCSAWLGTIEADGQRLIGYGAVFTLNAGVYSTTVTVLGKTYTLAFSGAPQYRTLTLTLTTPFTVGDYVGVYNASDTIKEPWVIPGVGRDNLRSVLTRTFQNPQMRWHGLFVDLCTPALIQPQSFWEIVRVLRPYGPLIFNITSPSAAGVDFIASCPWVQSGDAVFLEGAYLSGGADTTTKTAEAIAAAKRWGDGGKDIKVYALATIPNADPGPVETDPRIIVARDAFAATARAGWWFGAHWANLGIPNGVTPRPLPGRVASVGGWS